MFVVVFMLLVVAGVFGSMPAELVFIPADGTALVISEPTGGLARIAGGGCSAAALVGWFSVEALLLHPAASSKAEAAAKDKPIIFIIFYGLTVMLFSTF
jgi:hypothetical protein